MDDTIRTVLQSWLDRKLPEIMDRDIDLEPYLHVKPAKIIAITGFRRVGKTYLVFQLIKKLLNDTHKKKVVYVNFDDERIPENTEFLTRLVPEIKRMLGGPDFLFLDEIQEMPNWSKWLRRIYDNEDVRIFVTGSSSKVSSREIPGELRGRSLEVHVFPLSFHEFLRFRGVHVDIEGIDYSETGKSRLLRLLDEYVRYGGMPEVVLSPEFSRMEILQQYYATVVHRDIIERHKIKNEDGLRALLRLLLNSTQYSVSRLHRTMKSMGYDMGKNTIQNYLSYIESSYFIRSVSVFSPKVKDQMQHPRKVYFIDNGFISALSTKLSDNLGRLYENLVAVELMRRLNGPDEDIYYWKGSEGREVDFVLKNGLEIRELIQVSYDMSDIDTRKREMSALYRASNELGCDRLTVITGSEEGTEDYRGKKIDMIPLWKWLLHA